MTHQLTKKNSVRGYDLLTGNPFVDNGLAAIAALAGCESINELTLSKIKSEHGDGMELAHNNDMLSATWSIFPDSMLTNPQFSKDPCRLENYAKITTAILDKIGDEPLAESCDICGNVRSVDLDQLFRKVLPVLEGESEGKSKRRNDEGKRFLCRDWFPLAGSIKNDAQALPAASRSLNCCAKCLFAVQYLPQAVFSVKGRLTVFSSTSLTLWYKLAKSIAEGIKKLYAQSEGEKIATIGSRGSGEGSFSFAIRRMMYVMGELDQSDIGSVSMWMFTNIGMGANCEKQRIPNAAIEFVFEIARKVPLTEVETLINRDIKNYQTSLLNCIINRMDYPKLYPKKYGNEGASHTLFRLYQTKVLGHSISKLRTAYKIAKYIKAKAEDCDRIGIDLDKIYHKQLDVKKLIVQMVTDATEANISLDEYYDLFVVGRGSGNGHPWRLVKYYLLTDSDVDFPVSSTEIHHPTTSYGESRYRARFDSIGKAIRDSYIARKGVAKFEREVLGGLAHSQLGERWLWSQLQILAEEAQQQEPQTSFDPQATWRELVDGNDIHELLYLLRLLWTSQTFK